jgi:hypothetical protein
MIDRVPDMIELRREAGGSRLPGAMLFERRLAVDFFNTVIGEPDPPAHRAWGARSTRLSI